MPVPEREQPEFHKRRIIMWRRKKIRLVSAFCVLCLIYFSKLCFASVPEIPVHAKKIIERVIAFKEGNTVPEIVVLSDINESCWLDSRNIYYLPSQLTIEGDGVRVYIP